MEKQDVESTDPKAVKVVDEQQERLNAELERQGKEMWLAEQYVRRPCRVVLCGAIFIIICVMGAVASNLITNEPEGDRDYLVWSHPYVEEWDMREEAIATLKKEKGESDP
jgi:hypothetical protein